MFYMVIHRFTVDEYVIQIYPGDAHGMWLLVPELDPNPMVLIQDFLEAAFGLSIN